jgi:hypothetical protein
MQDDNRMIELLTDLLHEMREMKQEQREMKEEQREMKHEQREMKHEIQRVTSAIWELTTIMQKVLFEPAVKQARTLEDHEHRLLTVETELKLR